MEGGVLTLKLPWRAEVRARACVQVYNGCTCVGAAMALRSPGHCARRHKAQDGAAAASPLAHARTHALTRTHMHAHTQDGACPVTGGQTLYLTAPSISLTAHPFSVAHVAQAEEPGGEGRGGCSTAATRGSHVVVCTLHAKVGGHWTSAVRAHARAAPHTPLQLQVGAAAAAAVMAAALASPPAAACLLARRCCRRRQWRAHACRAAVPPCGPRDVAASSSVPSNRVCARCCAHRWRAPTTPACAACPTAGSWPWLLAA